MQKHSASKSKAELSEKLRKMLLKRTYTVSQLADVLNLSPKKIREIISELRSSGCNVGVQEDGQEPRFLIDGSATEKRGLKINAEKHYGGAYRFNFGAVSDTHLGSKYYRPEVLNAIYDNFASHGIRHVFHGGNYVEGEKHDKFGIVAHGMQGQIDYFIRHYPRRDGITTYFVAGDDHEGWWQQDTGIDIGRFTQNEAEKQGRTDLINLGYMEADVAVRVPGGAVCKLRVMHAGGGSSYAISYTAQKLIESLEGGDKPQILLIGHFHKAAYNFYRNVHAIQLGTTKAQDTFMRKKRLAAHVGGWRCSALLAKDGSVIELTATFLPFFNRGYYESMAIDQMTDEVTFLGANETYNPPKE